MNNKFFLCTLVLSLMGCSSLTPKKETRFTTSVNISEYNSIANQYMHKPTFGTIQHFNEYDAYYIKASRYGQGYLGIYITPDNLTSYQTALTKYLKWNEIALNNNDLVDKTIVSFEQSLTTWKLVFFSGSEKSHYFTVQACTDGLIETCTTMATLDSLNVKRLLSELDRFKQGTLLKIDTGSKYN